MSTHPLTFRGRRARGVAIVYGVLVLLALIAMCSLAVDYGRAQLVRSELQACADAAARAAAKGIPTSLANARLRARDVATLNTAGGATVTLADADFNFGKWNANTSQIDPASGSAIDAVEITAKRTVPLVFGAAFGKSSANVAARATARSVPSNSYRGFVGLNDMSFKNVAYAGSYKSSVTTNPTPGSSTGKGILSSNVRVEFVNNATVSGDIILGPLPAKVVKNGSLTISGTTTNQSAAFTAPADPAWSPATNPNSVPQNYTVNSNTTLPGGTYWFTSLTLNKRLTFSGPATLYVNGNIWTDDLIVTYQSKPSNLKIYQLGNNRKFDIQKDMWLYAEVQAPKSDLIGNNKLYLYGRGIFKTIDAKNNAEFYYDEDTVSSTGGGITLVN